MEKVEIKLTEKAYAKLKPKRKVTNEFLLEHRLSFFWIVNIYKSESDDDAAAPEETETSPEEGNKEPDNPKDDSG